jgi:YidC/Oxa1 family membrane protein insertase
MMEQRNLVLTIVLSLLILLGFQYFYERPRLAQQQALQQQAAQEAEKAKPTPTARNKAEPGAPSVEAPAEKAVEGERDRATVIQEGARVKIDTPRVSGSINLTGARLDDYTLKTYHETVDPKSPDVTLLNPLGTADAYYAEFGWTSADKSVAVPGQETHWVADHPVLTQDQPVSLTWDNGAGLRFVRQFSIDDNFMVSVVSRVENSTSAAVTLYPYALVSRSGTPHTLGYTILHEGVVGVTDGVLQEAKFGKIDLGSVSQKTTGGWLGLTDKYWLVALIPDQKTSVKMSYTYAKPNGADKYQVDYLGDGETAEPGGAIDTSQRIFAGAKEVKLLERYRDQLGIPRFEYAVDWGYFWFLTRPIFALLDFIYSLVGNFGISILILTVVIKAIFFPIASRSFVMMSKMKALNPKLQELKEKCGDDKVKLNQEMMALYKREKVNPVSGCLPVLLQIPVFFSLYKVLFVTIEMRHQPFYGWIKDLSAPDPTTVVNLFGLIPFDAPSFLMLGAWPLILGVTMFFQQRLNPQPTDPVQAKVFMVMPLIFTVMMAKFPAGLVIYYSWNNLLTILQQTLIMRRRGTA